MTDKLEDSELMDIFFNDAPEAKLMVNGSSLRIVRANDAFLDLMGMKRSQVIGMLWKDLDSPENESKYEQYIKELNTKDSMSFIIRNNDSDEPREYKCVYQISALSGTIGYLGSIKPNSEPDISENLQHLIQGILSANNERLNEVFKECLTALNLTFIGYYQYKDNQMIQQLQQGDHSSLESVVSRFQNSLISRVEKNGSLEISREVYPSSQSVDMLLEFQLESLYVYPVSFQNKLYGLIISGGKVEPINWNTSRSVLQILAHQVSFHLFDNIVEKQKKRQDEYDKLTGLRNRNSLVKKLEDLNAKGIEDEKYIALFAVGIDNLKSINEKIGVKYTDEILLSFSQLLTKTIRRMGQVYRTSGEGFAIMLSPHRNKDSSIKVVEKLVEKLSNPMLLSNGEEIEVNFNIGISIYPDEGQTIASLRKNVDLALLEAKNNGINNFIIFKHAETGVELKKRSEMEQRLKRAILDGRIQVFYQPKINTKTEELIGFEALVRWIDTNMGVVEPGFFIPLAEETGLIHEIGKIVATKTCNKLREWQDKYGLVLSCSINLSPTQLLNSKLPQIMEEIINKAGIHPQYVDFEITESMGLDSVPNLVEILNKIVDIGCTLSIDDFGTGHSSLEYVKKIPAKYIKIDQSFVGNIGLNPEDEAILDATIEMAKRLKREIIAEGVESEEQREYLLSRDVDYLQGYLFSKPLHENKVDSLLQELVDLMSFN